MPDSITFTVNGVKHSVGSEVDSDVMLVDYLRNYLHLSGTKYMCREGGCGACIVNASTSPGTATKAVNSCLVSIASCQDWDITTIEHLGNKQKGYHPLQKALAEHHGTQCGYCSPAWIMAMNGVLKNNKDITMLEVEKAFGSNICRCTGYRPIIECFKKFAKDAPKEDKIKDIENLSLCKKEGSCCKGDDDEGWCMVPNADKMKKIKLKDGKVWYRPINLTEVLNLLKTKRSGSDYMLVAGNTSKGGFPMEDYPRLLIDISHLQELRRNDKDQNLIVGAGLTLTELLEVLIAESSQDGFSYLKKVYDHVLLVAHIPIRNIGTIAGNLMIKHKYNIFQSDLFLLFTTIGAQLTIVDEKGTKTTHTMQNFLEVDMAGKVIINVLLPPLNEDEYELITFKLMPRAQSAHAIVNAGFLYKMDKSTKVVKEARIVYGALSTKFIRATATESYLVGKPLFTNDTLQAAIKVLDGELIVEEHRPEPAAAYRKYVAKALFYKGLLTLCPSDIRANRLTSGTILLHESRGLSSSKQVFDTDTSLWPLNEPMDKIEALQQCSGESQYTEDQQTINSEVFAALVLSTVCCGTILKIDASQALKLKGVIAFYTAKDIPGLNSFTPADAAFYSANEEVFADGTVKCYDQPIGVIVAETQAIANRASKLVKVKYSNVTTPVLDLKKVKDDTTRTSLYFSATATNEGSDVHKVISGDLSLHGQYHFPMETIVSVTKPTEEGLEVHSTSQYLDGTHIMVSRALGMDQNKVDVLLRRIGGGYGMKISRNILSAVACSLITYKLNRPCRLVQPLTTNMKAFGKRAACLTEYEVAVNSSGVIQYANTKFYEDNGYKINENLVIFAADVYNNCYDATKFNYSAYNSVTDRASNTFCRSPGTLEAIAATETIMERIAYELSLDPISVRLANLDTTKFNDIAIMIERIKTDAEYMTRRAAVDSFNTQNRWKKRGLRFALSRWPLTGAQRLPCSISIFHGDGTISISHGGVEMGQGINTKAVQVVAHFLNVPVSYIQVKANNSNQHPNSFLTGGSLTTQNIIIGLRKACEELLARLEPVKATLTNPTWKELITAAFEANVNLQCNGFASFLDAEFYDVYGVALTEVEIDCLTGEFQILRVDILQDVGQSVSPYIDVGQVEGGFMMAVGFWTCERLEYEEDTGKILTDRTWDYFVPLARDAPQKFNVYFHKKSYSHKTILGSKGVGEAPACIAVSVTFALREAIAMARQEIGIPTTEWFPIDGPFTTEAVCMSTKTNTEDFKLY